MPPGLISWGPLQAEAEQPVLSPNTRRNAGGLFNEKRSDDGALSLWTMEMVGEWSSVVLIRGKLFRRRSSVSLNNDNSQRTKSVVLRHISHSESETLLRFNLKSNLSVVVLTQDRYVEITYVICQRERYEKRRDLKNMLKRWPRFRRSQQRSYVHYLSATTESE